MKKLAENYYVTITGALILMIFALYNRFPIVSGDTVTYLNSAFSLQVPGDRPVFYGLFLRITSLGHTVWGPVAVQCLLLAYLCSRFIKNILPDMPRLRVLAILLFTSLGTVCGWYVGQLMPDIFTPMVFLACFAYLRTDGTKWEKALLLAIFYLSVVVHYSHYIIATGFLCVLLLAGFLFKAAFGAMRKRVLQLLGLTVICWLSLFTSNLIGGNGFVSGTSSHVFLMGKLSESGVLKKYLDETCPVKNYKICAYKDSLPPVAWEFVWSEEHSPVFRTGGWEANRQEYKEIVQDMLSRPKYWPILAYKSVGATLRQVVLSNIDESEEAPWRKYDKDNPLYQSLERNFQHEMNGFKTSRQNNRVLNIFFYDEMYILLLLLSSFACMLLLSGDVKKQAGRVYFLLILFMLMNAFATASLGNILTRLNSRGIWLLPMANVVFIYASLRQLWHKRRLSAGI